MEELEASWRERHLRDAVLSGSTEAWRVLYEGSFRDIYAYVHFRSKEMSSDVEDVVQEVWLTAVRKMRNFDPARGRFEQWLRGIADNLLRNRRRRSKSRRALEAGLRVKLADAEDAGRAQGEVEHVARILTKLPKRYRDILKAKYEDGLSAAGIASMWGETPKAIESLLSRAKSAFRVAYQHDEKRSTNV